MKLIYIILDGLPDDNTQNGSTPAEVADAPALHSIATHGTPLMVKTSFPGLPVGSIVANLGLLGYNPYKYFPHGRSYFELIARHNAPIEQGDLILRVNLISLDENDNIADFTAGQISNELGDPIISDLQNRLPDNFTIVRGKNYRNTMIVRGMSITPPDLVSFEPHSRIGENIYDLRIRHATTNLGTEQRHDIRQLNSTMMATISHLRELNQKYGSKADMLWFWAPSGVGKLFDFKDHFRFSTAHIIAGSDFMYGIGKAANIAFTPNDRYTGEADTDFIGKGQEALNLLKNGAEFVFIHVNATDEEAHQRRFDRKKLMIEQIDRHIIQPIKEFVDQHDGPIKLIIGGDHYTSSKTGNHLDWDSPFVIYDAARPANTGVKLFSEAAIIGSSLTTLNSYDMIERIRDNTVQQ